MILKPLHGLNKKTTGSGSLNYLLPAQILSHRLNCQEYLTLNRLFKFEPVEGS